MSDAILDEPVVETQFNYRRLYAAVATYGVPVGPRVHGRDADAASRAPIKAAELGWAYGHGLGHGVGLQIHEGPTLRPDSTDVLEPGNVVSVEPGIYLPGDAGVRIEDLVLVTDEGSERLTQFTKELITVT